MRSRLLVPVFVARNNTLSVCHELHAMAEDRLPCWLVMLTCRLWPCIPNVRTSLYPILVQAHRFEHRLARNVEFQPFLGPCPTSGYYQSDHFRPLVAPYYIPNVRVSVCIHLSVAA